MKGIEILINMANISLLEVGVLERRRRVGINFAYAGSSLCTNSDSLPWSLRLRFCGQMKLVPQVLAHESADLFSANSSVHALHGTASDYPLSYAKAGSAESNCHWISSSCRSASAFAGENGRLVHMPIRQALIKARSKAIQTVRRNRAAASFSGRAGNFFSHRR